jgi:hypothetical protein
MKSQEIFFFNYYLITAYVALRVRYLVLIFHFKKDGVKHPHNEVPYFQQKIFLIQIAMTSCAFQQKNMQGIHRCAPLVQQKVGGL